MTSIYGSYFQFTYNVIPDITIRTQNSIFFRQLRYSKTCSTLSRTSCQQAIFFKRMGLCTGRLHQLIQNTTYHIQTMSIIIQRYPFTEARTKMIPEQPESCSGLIHLAYVSQSLPSSMENSSCLSYLLDKQGKTCRQQEKTDINEYRDTKQPFIYRQKGMDGPSPSPVKLLGLLITSCCHPSLLLVLR